MKIKIIALFTCIMLLSCKETKTIKCYKTQTPSEEGVEFIYWYLMQMDNGSYSYYASSTPVQNFSNVTWKNSAQVPEELEGSNVVPLEEVEVPEETTEDPVETEGSESDSNDSGDDGGDSGSDGGDAGGGDGGGE